MSYVQLNNWNNSDIGEPIPKYIRYAWQKYGKSLDLCLCFYVYFWTISSMYPYCHKKKNFNCFRMFILNANSMLHKFYFFSVFRVLFCVKGTIKFEFRTTSTKTDIKKRKLNELNKNLKYFTISQFIVLRHSIYLRNLFRELFFVRL